MPFFRQLTSVGLIQNEFGPIFVEKNKDSEFTFNCEENKIDLLLAVSCRAKLDHRREQMSGPEIL